MTKLIYLDHAATTYVKPQVLDAMLPYFTEHFGNPSSLHAVGRDAHKAIDAARTSVARAIGAKRAAPLHIGLFDDMTAEDFPFEGRLALPLFRAIALGRG